MILFNFVGGMGYFIHWSGEYQNKKAKKMVKEVKEVIKDIKDIKIERRALNELLNPVSESTESISEVTACVNCKHYDPSVPWRDVLCCKRSYGYSKFEVMDCPNTAPLVSQNAPEELEMVIEEVKIENAIDGLEV